MVQEKKVILQPYLVDGKVDYEKIRMDKDLLDLIDKIKNKNISQFSHEEKFAFWLNAYNMLTIQSVLDQLEKNPQWEGVKGIFSKLKFFLKRHKIAGRKVSLYSLENSILRKKFKDPRIHFAINCASYSCPYLPNKQFEAETLDNYLEELTIDFINNQNGIIVQKNEIKISPIFKWYKKDFKASGGVLEFINKYWKGASIPQNFKISYLDYNWNLNKQ